MTASYNRALLTLSFTLLQACGHLVSAEATCDDLFDSLVATATVPVSLSQEASAASGEPDLAHLYGHDAAVAEAAKVEPLAVPSAAPDSGDLFFLAAGPTNAKDRLQNTEVIPAIAEVPVRKLPQLTSIFETSVDVTPVARAFDEDADEELSSVRPADTAAQQFGVFDSAVLGGNERTRFPMMYYLWHTPATRHKPLYFEQPNIERYGTHVGSNCFASAVATAKFVGQTLSLPYQMGANPPRECRYTLGVYRPGNCTPHFFHASPLSSKGLLYQGAAVTGLVFLFP